MRTVAITHTAQGLEATFCVLVQDTPDGYLNLREGPGMNFKVKAKLVPHHDILKANAKNKEWTRVTTGETGSQEVSGWVYSKYVDKFDCPKT